MKTINKLIKEQIKIEQSYIEEHEQVLEILKPLEGKQFSLKTFNKKALKGFEFKSKFGMFYILGKYEHLIGYNSSSGVSVENFKSHDACHGSASLERIEKLKNLDVKKLQRIQNKINKCFNELCFLFNDLETESLDSYNNPIYHKMLNEIYRPEDERKELKLTDFYYIRKERS